MKIFKKLWIKFDPGFESDNDLIRKDIWTRDILRIMLIVVGISTVLILVGVIIGIFDFIGTLPIYIILVSHNCSQHRHTLRRLALGKIHSDPDVFWHGCVLFDKLDYGS